jgi:hypothetical protein
MVAAFPEGGCHTIIYGNCSWRLRLRSRSQAEFYHSGDPAECDAPPRPGWGAIRTSVRRSKCKRTARPRRRPEPIIILEKRGAGFERNDESVPALGVADVVRREESGDDELSKMRPELVALDRRPVRAKGEAAEPLTANIVVAFWEREAASVDAVVKVRKMKEASHVECLADGIQLLHEGVIETGEMFVLQ